MNQAIHWESTSGGPRRAARVLVVAAHPDDEVLGCAGTIARHVAAGDQVHVLVLGEGVTSRYARRDTKQAEAELDTLRKQIYRAAETLGAASVHPFGLPDNRFDSVDLLDIVKIVEDVCGNVEPTIVYTHHGGDLNIDHRLTFEAVLTACRPYPGQGVKTLYSFEVPSSTEWRAPTAAGAFLPTVYVDISETLSKKLDAMAVYEGEVRDFPHPRPTHALEIIARGNGVEVGLEAAERFCLIRTLL